jgi:hypothetical protein
MRPEDEAVAGQDEASADVRDAGAQRHGEGVEVLHAWSPPKHRDGAESA